MQILKQIKILVLSFVMLSQVAGANDVVDEKLLRAAFIERITRFIAWPEQKKEQSLFSLCIYQDEELRKVFSEIYKEMKVKSKKVRIDLVSDFESIESCELLYFSSPLDDAKKRQALSAAKAASVLLITEFEDSGLHINLYPLGGKLRIEVDPYTLENIGFKVNIQLLNYAKIAKRSELN